MNATWSGNQEKIFGKMKWTGKGRENAGNYFKVGKDRSAANKRETCHCLINLREFIFQSETNADCNVRANLFSFPKRFPFLLFVSKNEEFLFIFFI